MTIPSHLMLTKGATIMTYTTTRLADDRVLVNYADGAISRDCILDGTEYFELAGNSKVDTAKAEFDDEIKAFFKPLTDAAEKVEKAMEMPIDPAFFIVENEGSEGVAPTARVVRKLSKDTVILRMIESGDTSRLVWVDKVIEIKAA